MSFADILDIRELTLLFVFTDFIITEHLQSFCNIVSSDTFCQIYFHLISIDLTLNTFFRVLKNSHLEPSVFHIVFCVPKFMKPRTVARIFRNIDSSRLTF